MKKNFSARSDVIWPFKKIICENRIKTVSEIYILLKVFNRKKKFLNISLSLYRKYYHYNRNIVVR